MAPRPDRHPSAFLLAAGLAVVAVVSIAGAMLTRSHDRARAAEDEVAATKALHAAEAGLAVAVEKLRVGGNTPRAVDLVRRPLGDAGYTVRVNGVRGLRVELVSRGECRGVTRTVTGIWEIDPEAGNARRCHER